MEANLLTYREESGGIALGGLALHSAVRTTENDRDLKVATTAKIYYIDCSTL